MSYKKLKFIFLVLLCLVFILGPSFVLARELETWYPPLPFPGVESPNEFMLKIEQDIYPSEQALGLYVKYFYYLFISIVGLIGFGAIAYGGFQYLVSLGSPVKIIAAREQILNGFLAIIILLSSYLILTIINPDLTIFSASKKLAQLPEPQYYRKCLSGSCVLVPGDQEDECQRDEDCPVELPPYREIPLGRMVEWVVKRSTEAKDAAKRVKDASDRLEKLTDELKELLEECDCEYSCPKCCTDGEGNYYQDCSCQYGQCTCTECVGGPGTFQIKESTGNLGEQIKIGQNDSSQRLAWQENKNYHDLSSNQSLLDYLKSFLPENLFPKSISEMIPPVGAQAGVSGINIDPANPNGKPSAEELKNLGATWVRLVYKSDVGFDYNYIKELKDEGINVLLILNQETLYPPQGYGNYGDTFKEDFAAKAGEIAQNLGNLIDAYQIWNEQDHHSPASIYLDADYYASLLEASYGEIKKHTGADVIMGGLVSDLNNLLNYLATVQNRTNSFDGISVHPYVTTPEGVWAIIQAVMNVANKPIWVTEFGWQTSNQENQAEFLGGVCEVLNEEVATIIWYAWHDAMNPGFGLIDSSGNAKESYNAFQQFCANVAPGDFPPSSPFPGVPGCFHLTADASYSAPDVNVKVCFHSDGADGHIRLEHPKGEEFNLWIRGEDISPFCFGDNPEHTGSPYKVYPGQTIAVTFTGVITATLEPDCANKPVSITCVFSVDEEGNFSSNCGRKVVETEFVPDPCDPCPNRIEIIKKQGEISHHLILYQRLIIELKIAQANLAKELLNLELAEALMRDSYPVGPVLSYDEFWSIKRKEEVNIKKLDDWAYIDYKDDPNTPKYENIEDPTTFFIFEEGGNKELIRLVESLLAASYASGPPPPPDWQPPADWVPPETGTFVWPLAESTRITQNYGCLDTDFARKSYTKCDLPDGRKGGWHNAIDISARENEDLLSSADGTIIGIGDLGKYSYGKWIVVWHPEHNVSTLYAHLNDFGVNIDEGEEVFAGQVIGYADNTGYSKGHHLHFTVFLDQPTFHAQYGDYVPRGTDLNPFDYVQVP